MYFEPKCNFIKFCRSEVDTSFVNGRESPLGVPRPSRSREKRIWILTKIEMWKFVQPFWVAKCVWMDGRTERRAGLPTQLKLLTLYVMFRNSYISDFFCVIFRAVRLLVGVSQYRDLWTNGLLFIRVYKVQCFKLAALSLRAVYRLFRWSELSACGEARSIYYASTEIHTQ